MKKTQKKKTLGPVVTGMLMGVGIVLAQAAIAVAVGLLNLVFVYLSL